MARVLVVDDEDTVRFTIEKHLKKAGYETTTAGDAAQALDAIRKEEFDVIVSDIMMPETNGIELLKSVSTTSPSSKVILVTGEPDIDTATKALRHGAFDYLSKPFEGVELCKAVEKAMKFKSIEDENRRYRESLEAKVRERTARLQTVMDGTVEALGSIMEMRDSYTSGHQRRVTMLACAIAAELSLDTESVEGLRLAGLLHDIGKINIPAEILAKPSRLNNAEFDLVKGHVRAGFNVLKGVDFPWPVAQMVLQHHERIDGSGYPEGVAGGKILLEARVLAVSDVVEAMASHRPYRPALGIDQALDEIKKNSGVLYDPDVARACLDLCWNTDWDFDKSD